MKVKELIELLQKEDENKPVTVLIDDVHYDVKKVEGTEDTDAVEDVVAVIADV